MSCLTLTGCHALYPFHLIARSLWNDSSRKDLIDNRNYIGDGFYRDCKCTTICHDTFDLLAFDLRPSNVFCRPSILVKLPPASLQTFTP